MLRACACVHMRFCCALGFFSKIRGRIKKKKHQEEKALSALIKEKLQTCQSLNFNPQGDREL